MKYEPRRCTICGKEYIPFRCNQKTCGDPKCRRANSNIARKEYVKKNYATIREGNRDYMRRKRDEQKWTPKPDTIVAEGYAERQMAASLKMAGKVRTEL